MTNIWGVLIVCRANRRSNVETYLNGTIARDPNYASVEAGMQAKSNPGVLVGYYTVVQMNDTQYNDWVNRPDVNGVWSKRIYRIVDFSDDILDREKPLKYYVRYEPKVLLNDIPKIAIRYLRRVLKTRISTNNKSISKSDARVLNYRTDSEGNIITVQDFLARLGTGYEGYVDPDTI